MLGGDDARHSIDEDSRRSSAADWSGRGSATSSITGELSFNRPEQTSSMTVASNGLLSFPSEWVCGREEETRLIQEMFCRVQQQKGQQKKQLHEGHESSSSIPPCCQVLLVRGPSGSGKTRLLRASLGKYTYHHGGYFVEGKFNQYQRTGEIYSALAAALSDLCELVVSTSTATTKKRAHGQDLTGPTVSVTALGSLREKLRQQLGSEAKLLTMLIPGLCHLLPELRTNICEAEVEEIGNWDGHQALTRLKQLCIEFLSVVVTPQQPVAIFLDDLQWCDDASMQIIVSLVQSAKLSHILWVVSFRNDSDGYLSTMDEFLSTLVDENEKEMNAPLTVLDVGNLDFEGTSKLVEAWASPSIFDLRELSEIIYQKTNGNPYFMEQFLKQLHRNRMLFMKYGRWMWEIDRIRNETDVSDNVAVLVTQRIQNLSQTAQQVLQFAAFLGYRFDVAVLRLLTEELLGDRPTTPVPTALKNVLETAVESGLVERTNDRRSDDTGYGYKFSHDRVQQCLFLLVEDRTVFHYMIGTALCREWFQCRWGLNPALAGSVLLLAADHLNQGRDAIQDQKELLNLVRLNQAASQWSVRQCTFGTALVYLRRAKELLGGDAFSWQNQYELSLQVSTSLGHLEVSNGHHDRGCASCHEVLEKATCLDDKLDSYSTLIQSLGRQEAKLSGSIDLGIRVLRMLGTSLPRRVDMLHFFAEIVRTRRTIAAMSDSQLLQLTPLVDKKKLAVIAIMHKTSWVAFVAANAKRLLGFTSVVLMRMTCQYGYTEWTPAIVARYGGLEAALGNLKTARRLLCISVELIDQARSKASKCRAMLILHGMLSQWFQPQSCAIDGLSRGYVWGIESGEFEMALSSAAHYLPVAAYSRFGLVAIESEARSFCQQAQDFSLEPILVTLLPIWQCFLNLLGEAEDPAKLTGEAMVEEELETKLNGGTNLLARHVMLNNSIKIARLFRDWEKAERLFDEYASGRDAAFRGHFVNFQAIFLEGLLSYEFLERHKTPRRKYLRRARNATRQVCAWAKMGVPLCQPIAALFLAEKMVLHDTGHKRAQEVMTLYEQALDEANQLGSLQIEAIIAERVFEVLSKAYRNEDLAMSYLCKAIDVYSDWEAEAKVEELDEIRRNMSNAP